MYIEKFEKNPSGPSVTVTFNYNEVLNLFNAMYQYTQNADRTDETYFKRLQETLAEISFVKDIVKHGMVQEDTVQFFKESGYNDVIDT
jgi:hypothetical protein